MFVWNWSIIGVPFHTSFSEGKMEGINSMIMLMLCPMGLLRFLLHACRIMINNKMVSPQQFPNRKKEGVISVIMWITRCYRNISFSVCVCVTLVGSLSQIGWCCLPKTVGLPLQLTAFFHAHSLVVVVVVQLFENISTFRKIFNF